MANLHERTGATLFLVSARDSVNDTLAPAFGDAGNTSAFFLEHLDMTANEFIRKFQSWCDARRDDSKSKGSLLRVLQLECRCLISEGLNRILKRKNIVMAYENYESQIMVRHKVQLRAWPAGLKFTSPHNLHTIAEVQRLRDALVSGACTWVMLSADEHTAISEKVGEAPKKKRKPRKDKGTKKATAAAVPEPESDAARPRKRARKSAIASQIPPGPRSASVVPSSDESEGGEVDIVPS
ncbi:hypothetical protein DFP72DRAFT_1021381 [Ephemerocybe angulata]|uniref:Uncharacterized protein n=1 Tax=Ephemerocybe angulata TaxID=980116 RepID=A0A8H6HC50_9AGAR|nr:hypothetical protein DFP72DRAFT_1021381 [Tulosesus angulatus]